MVRAATQGAGAAQMYGFGSALFSPGGTEPLHSPISRQIYILSETSPVMKFSLNLIFCPRLIFIPDFLNLRPDLTHHGTDF